jgi:3-oxoacyl-(acyl-carrier-protein) synthase
MTLAISAWSAISPFGYGRDAFAAGVISRTDISAPVGAGRSVPDERACVVPDFDVRQLLGAKGTRAMNRGAGMAVATAGQLIEDIAPHGCGPDSRDDTGVVLGTTTGSAQSAMDLTRTSLQAEKPFYIEAAVAPVSVMNYAAGQIAIWHQIRGPNVTVAAGRATGLVALNYARRMLLTGRARHVLCGAVEEYTHARAWLEHHRQGDGRVVGEGCAMLLLQPEAAARSPLATLLAVETLVCRGGDTAGAVATGVRRLLAVNGVPASDVWAACGDEHPALREIFGETATSRVPSADLIGDTSAASAIFQVAALLSVASTGGRPAGTHAVVAAAAADESVAVALFRLPFDRCGRHDG